MGRASIPRRSLPRRPLEEERCESPPPPPNRQPPQSDRPRRRRARRAPRALCTCSQRRTLLPEIPSRRSRSMPGPDDLREPTEESAPRPPGREARLSSPSPMRSELLIAHSSEVCEHGPNPSLARRPNTALEASLNATLRSRRPGGLRGIFQTRAGFLPVSLNQGRDKAGEDLGVRCNASARQPLS